MELNPVHLGQSVQSCTIDLYPTFSNRIADVYCFLIISRSSLPETGSVPSRTRTGMILMHGPETSSRDAFLPEIRCPKMTSFSPARPERTTDHAAWRIVANDVPSFKTNLYSMV